MELEVSYNKNCCPEGRVVTKDYGIPAETETASFSHSRL